LILRNKTLEKILLKPLSSDNKDKKEDFSIPEEFTKFLEII
jgi:hypothetical protein